MPTGWNVYDRQFTGYGSSNWVTARNLAVTYVRRYGDANPLLRWRQNFWQVWA